MRCKALVTLGLLSVVARSAYAAEFIPGWGVDGIWSSNVLRTETDHQSDLSVRTGPNARVRQMKGDLTYDLDFRVRYEDYLRFNGISEFSYFANGRGNWSITRNTDLVLTEQFISSASLSGLFEGGSPLDTGGTVLPNRERLTANRLLGAVNHRLSPLWQLHMEVTNNLYDYQNPDQTDSISTGGSMNVTRALSPRLIVGGGAQFTRQEFDNRDQTTGTSIYQGFGLVQYQFSPTWSLSAQAGPAWAIPDGVTTPPGEYGIQQYINGRIESCPQNSAGVPVVIQNVGVGFEGCPAPIILQVQGTDRLFLVLPSTSTTTVPLLSSDVNSGGSLNYFGRFVLSKEWRQWQTTLSYDRSASNSSGFGQSTALDVLAGELTWQPSELWSVTLRGLYSSQSALSDAQTLSSVETSLRQETLDVPVLEINPDGTPVIGPNGQPVTGLAPAPVPVPVDANAFTRKSKNKATVDSFRVELRGVRRISRHLSLNGSLTYWNQTSNRTIETTGSLQRDVYLIGFGFTWTFDPIPL